MDNKTWKVLRWIYVIPCMVAASYLAQGLIVFLMSMTSQHLWGSPDYIDTGTAQVMGFFGGSIMVYVAVLVAPSNRAVAAGMGFVGAALVAFEHFDLSRTMPADDHNYFGMTLLGAALAVTGSVHWRKSPQDPTLGNGQSESGRREILTPAPHTTGHTDP